MIDIQDANATKPETNHEYIMIRSTAQCENIYMVFLKRTHAV